MPIDVEMLKSERDQLKRVLRELETEQRKTEAILKTLRQQELKTKREIEALTTLVDLNERREDQRGEPQD